MCVWGGRASSDESVSRGERGRQSSTPGGAAHAPQMRQALPVKLRWRSVPLAPSATVASWTTLIWLVVSVPVLSEQMTVVQPSVSTDGSFL